MTTKRQPGLVFAIAGLSFYGMAYIFYELIIFYCAFGGFYYYGEKPFENLIVPYFLLTVLSIGYILGLIASIHSLYSIIKSIHNHESRPGLIGLTLGLLVFLSGSIFIYSKYFYDFYYDHFNTKEPPKTYLTSSLTFRSTRTPPALPSALSQLPTSSAPFSASAQAWPVSFIR